MRRYGGIYEVVPVMERLVEDDLSGESVLESLTDLSLGLISLVHNLGHDPQPLLCHGVCSPAAGIGDSAEGRVAPGKRHLGEKAVSDGIELGTVRRVVHDENLHSDAVGEVHEFLLDYMVTAGVGAATVAEDDNHLRVRVNLLEVIVPDPLYVVAHELGGVVAGAYCKIPRVVCQVVDAVRHNHALGECLEIMVVGGRRGGAVHLAVPLEIADCLLFLGVNAEEGDSPLDTGVLRRTYLDELGTPVLHLAQRKALRERPLLESFVLEHLPHDIVGHVMSPLKKLAADLGERRCRARQRSHPVEGRPCAWK